MRRPIAAREAGWAKKFAGVLKRLGVRPNTVSIASVLFAALAAASLLAASAETRPQFRVALFCAAALCIQLRLLCNLFDGMLAVEYKQGSPLGPIFNDFPDRPADVLILLGCGYSGSFSGIYGGSPAWLPLAGWCAASLALLTAYVRVLGVAIGARESFIGPMAKQHRMAAATIACLLAALEAAFTQPPRAMALVLVIIIAGCLLTIARRLRLIAHDLTIAATIGPANDTTVTTNPSAK